MQMGVKLILYKYVHTHSHFFYYYFVFVSIGTAWRNGVLLAQLVAGKHDRERNIEAGNVVTHTGGRHGIREEI